MIRTYVRRLVHEERNRDLRGFGPLLCQTLATRDRIVLYYCFALKR